MNKGTSEIIQCLAFVAEGGSDASGIAGLYRFAAESFAGGGQHAADNRERITGYTGDREKGRGTLWGCLAGNGGSLPAEYLKDRNLMRVSKKYLAPSIYSYPYWRLKSNIRFYKGVFCLFGHPLVLQ